MLFGFTSRGLNAPMLGGRVLQQTLADGRRVQLGGEVVVPHHLAYRQLVGYTRRRAVEVGAPSFAALNAIGLNKFSAFVPASKLTPATEYEWSVVCACSITPLSLSPTSGLDTFLFPGTARIERR